MYTAELQFKRSGRVSCDDAASAIHSAIWVLICNGQLIHRDVAVLDARGGYRAIVGLPERDSMRSSLYSKQVWTALGELRKNGLQPPACRVLGVDLDSQSVCTCRKPASLVLEALYISVEVPLWCGGCRGIVPLYRVPYLTTYGNYYPLLSWASHYRALDKIWLDSGVGERFAYRQLSRHDSDLSTTGREICKDIERQSRIPAYYFLKRYYGRSLAAERKRRCPGCDGRWLLDPPWHRVYEFRCDRCRLVSHVGDEVR